MKTSNPYHDPAPTTPVVTRTTWTLRAHRPDERLIDAVIGVTMLATAAGVISLGGYIICGAAPWVCRCAAVSAALWLFFCVAAVRVERTEETR